MAFAFAVPTLAANPAARVGHPALLFGAEEDKDRGAPPAKQRSSASPSEKLLLSAAAEFNSVQESFGRAVGGVFFVK